MVIPFVEWNKWIELIIFLNILYYVGRTVYKTGQDNKE